MGIKVVSVSVWFLRGIALVVCALKRVLVCVAFVACVCVGRVVVETGG